ARPVARAVSRIHRAAPMVIAVAAFSAVFSFTVSVVATPTAPAVTPRAAPRVAISIATARPPNAPATIAPHCVRLLQTASDEIAVCRPISPLGRSGLMGVMRGSPYWGIRLQEGIAPSGHPGDEGVQGIVMRESAAPF